MVSYSTECPGTTLSSQRVSLYIAHIFLHTIIILYMQYLIAGAYQPTNGSTVSGHCSMARASLFHEQCHLYLIMLYNIMWSLTIYQIYAVLIINSYTASHGYAFLDTLLNPVLSDHFGFSVKDQSYVVVATAILFILSTFLL